MNITRLGYRLGQLQPDGPAPMAGEEGRKRVLASQAEAQPCLRLVWKGGREGTVDVQPIHVFLSTGAGHVQSH